MPAISENPVGGPVIHGSYIGTLKQIGWVSGTASSGRLRQNQWTCVTDRPGDGGSTGRSVAKITGESR